MAAISSPTPNALSVLALTTRMVAAPATAQFSTPTPAKTSWTEPDAIPGDAVGGHRRHYPSPGRARADVRQPHGMLNCPYPHGPPLVFIYEKWCVTQSGANRSLQTIACSGPIYRRFELKTGRTFSEGGTKPLDLVQNCALGLLLKTGGYQAQAKAQTLPSGGFFALEHATGLDEYDRKFHLPFRDP